LLQFVKATSSSGAQPSRAQTRFLNKLVGLLFGEKNGEKKEEEERKKKNSPFNNVLDEI